MSGLLVKEDMYHKKRSCHRNDMYPLLDKENPVRRVIFMRYSYEFKRKCVEMYRQGVLPKAPLTVFQKNYLGILFENGLESKDAQGPLKH